MIVNEIAVEIMSQTHQARRNGTIDPRFTVYVDSPTMTQMMAEISPLGQMSTASWTFYGWRVCAR